MKSNLKSRNLTTARKQSSSSAILSKNASNLHTKTVSQKNISLTESSIYSDSKQSCLSKIDSYDSNQIKIMQLKAAILKQNQKKEKLTQENIRLKNIAYEFELKEQKMFKKQDLLNLKAQSNGMKQCALKNKSLEISKICENSIKKFENFEFSNEVECKDVLNPIENLPKCSQSDSESQHMKFQIINDAKTNKELINIFRIVRLKYLLSKAKYSVKKDLKIKQHDQIKKMLKLIQNLKGIIGNTEVKPLNLSNSIAEMNFRPNYEKNSVQTSVYDLKGYLSQKQESLSSQIIYEKMNFQLYKKILKKYEDRKSNIKKINELVIEILFAKKTKNFIESEEELKQKEEKLQKLQMMLKFWIEEYSNLMTPNELNDDYNFELEINL